MADPAPLEQFVEQQLKSGKYQSYEAMVQAGLRLLQDREAELDEIADALRPTVEDYRNGERGTELDIEEIKKAGRQRLTTQT